jgi:hypothetical protein
MSLLRTSTALLLIATSLLYSGLGMETRARAADPDVLASGCQEQVLLTSLVFTSTQAASEAFDLCHKICHHRQLLERAGIIHPYARTLVTTSSRDTNPERLKRLIAVLHDYFAVVTFVTLSRSWRVLVMIC